MLRPHPAHRRSRSLLVALVSAGLALALPATAFAQSCSKEDFAAAVDQAGAGMRAFNAEANPRLKRKLKQLQEKKRWPEAGYEEKGFDYLQDGRIADLDTEANELLTRIDDLGRAGESGTAGCEKLAELKTAGAALLAVMKSKSDYTLAKLDGELGTKSAESKPTEEKPPVAKPASPGPATAAAPKPSPPTSGERRENWDTTAAATPSDPPPPASPEASSPYMIPPDAFVTDEQGYTIDEIREASRGFFGTISTSLASVIEHAFSLSGRPTAYVLGSEGGGAFLAGLRYGKGTLYLRSGGTQEIYWHGPSIGGDIGADGGRTLYLIYRLKNPEGLYRRFIGVDGSAYFVGGVGITFLKGGEVIMAPIRSGIGFRLGANVGYVRFTSKPTWNPF
ncbi:MAG: DUF1134 domain-containing protein [Hyphomicrobium sp.]